MKDALRIMTMMIWLGVHEWKVSIPANSENVSNASVVFVPSWSGFDENF